MRKISTLFLALVLSSIALPISVEGQTRVCPDMSVFSGSMLQWLTGKGQVNTTASSGLGAQLTQLASAGKEAELRSKLNAPGADSLSGLGVFWLALGDVESSVRAFDLDSLPDTACSQPELKLAARYLKQYGSQTPLFPGFNGGFYQFLKDSLYGGEKLSVERYEKALSALYGWMRMTGFGSPLAMELFADVLYRHPDRFVGNFFGCMAYMRAATLCDGASREVLMTKALYALEAPNTAARRFDRYRFTQLQKVFLAALEGEGKGDDAEGSPSVEVQTGGILFMDARDTGGLGSYLSKARTKHLEDQAKVVVTDQVDARKVKKEASFNMYAIFVISTVIASVVFFWVKIKRAQSRKSA